MTDTKINLFHLLEAEVVIARSGGGFEQLDLYQRTNQDPSAAQEEVYIRKGSKYFRLLDNGKTSGPTLFWDEASVALKVGRLGRMVLA